MPKKQQTDATEYKNAVAEMEKLEAAHRALEYRTEGVKEEIEAATTTLDAATDAKTAAMEVYGETGDDADLKAASKAVTEAESALAELRDKLAALESVTRRKLPLLVSAEQDVEATAPQYWRAVREALDDEIKSVIVPVLVAAYFAEIGAGRNTYPTQFLSEFARNREIGAAFTEAVKQEPTGAVPVTPPQLGVHIDRADLEAIRAGRFGKDTLPEEPREPTLTHGPIEEAQPDEPLPMRHIAFPARVLDGEAAA